MPITRNIIISLLVLPAVMLFSACSSAVRFSSSGLSESVGKSIAKAEPSNSSRINKSTNLNYSLTDSRLILLEEASKWLGTPYCYGGESKDCTDCSGFVQSVFSSLGYSIPRTASAQFSFSQIIDYESAIPGDLVFFRKNQNINHVGIYIGNSEIIHASTSSGVIRQSLNDTYLKNHFAGIGRVF